MTAFHQFFKPNKISKTTDLDQPNKNIDKNVVKNDKNMPPSHTHVRSPFPDGLCTFSQSQS